MKLLVKSFGMIAGTALCLCIGCTLSGCTEKASDASAEERIREGWEHYNLADYKQAIRAFDDVLAADTLNQEDTLNALYGKAVTWDLRQPVASQNNDLAATLYRQIIESAPEHDLAAWSSLALARMTHLAPVGQNPDFAEVRAAYQKVIDAFPDHLAGQEALMYQQSTLIQSLEKKYTEQAVERLQQFIEEQPDARYISAAYDLLAHAYETLGEAEKQLDARLNELRTIEIDPVSPQASDLSHRYWKLATTAEFLVGDFKTAKTYYMKLVEEYPLDFRKFPAKQAIKRMDEMERRLREDML